MTDDKSGGKPMDDKSGGKPQDDKGGGDKGGYDKK